MLLSCFHHLGWRAENINEKRLNNKISTFLPLDFFLVPLLWVRQSERNSTKAILRKDNRCIDGQIVNVLCCTSTFHERTMTDGLPPLTPCKLTPLCSQYRHTSKHPVNFRTYNGGEEEEASGYLPQVSSTLWMTVHDMNKRTKKVGTGRWIWW